MTKVQFVSMLTSVLKLTKMATLFTTVTNTLNAIITKDHLHAHVKRYGLVPHTVQEAAQTTTNAPTVFKPSQPLLVAKEGKVKDSKTVLIHLVYVQTGQVVPISCWMTSKEMDTNGLAHQVTLHPRPIPKPTSSQNVLTLTNAMLKTQLTTVIQMLHVTTTQVVTHAAVTKDSDKLVMAMLVNGVTLMNVHSLPSTQL